MTCKPLEKLTFNELFNSTTMFYMNEEIEQFVDKEIESKVLQIQNQLSSINTKESFGNYIKTSPDSLDNILAVLGISEERFKRIVSMIRKDRGYVFSTEWSLSLTRKYLIESAAMTDSIVSLLWDGKNNAQFMTRIPKFYLDAMDFKTRINTNLNSELSIRQLVKSRLEGAYSNKIGDAILKEIEGKIGEICTKNNLPYQKQERIPLIDRTVSFVVGTKKDPKILIDVSYVVTTSSSQTKRKDAARATRAKLKQHSSAYSKILYVSILDGAGWLARQADMKEIYSCSDFVLNLQNLCQLEDIVQTL